jgi:hypothetical protein
MGNEKTAQLGDRVTITNGHLSSMNVGATGELVLRQRDGTAFVVRDDEGERRLGFAVEREG